MKLFCHKCGCLVAEIVAGSRIKRGTIHTCYSCQQKQKPPKSDVADFLMGMMKGKK